MSFQIRPLVRALVLCCLGAPAGLAQQSKANLDSGPPTSEVTTDADTKSTDAHARSIFGEELGGHLTVIADGAFQQDYDDNIFSSSLLRVSDSVSRFSGRISATMRRKHLILETHYLPGYAVYTTYSGRNSFSQQGGVLLDYATSARTSLRFTGLVSDASSAALPNFMLTRQGDGVIPVFSPGEMQVNARVLSSTSDLTISHRSSAADNMYVRVEGATTSFGNEFGTGVVSGVSQETYSVGASTGWMHAFNGIQSIGVEAGERYLAFISPAQHAHYQFLKARYERQLNKQFTFRFGAGPGFRADAADKRVRTSVAFDASLTRTRRAFTTGLAVSRDDRLSQLQGSLGSTQASAFFSYQPLRRWNASGSFGYSKSSLLHSVGGSDAYSTSGRIGYRLSPSWQAFTSYSYLVQAGESVGLNQNFHRNLISFGISYTLSPAVRY